MKHETLQIIIMGCTGHGKSSLIGRLLFETNSLPKEKTAEIKKISKELGKDTELAFIIDQLHNEREKNISTHNSSLFFSTGKRYNCIIDLPDNVQLIEQFITGTNNAQAAVLIVDIHENMIEQTKQYIYVIKILGIKKIIVLFNKMDLINYDQEKFQEAKQKIVSLFSDCSLEPFGIIPISAKLGINIVKKASEIPWYNGPYVSKTLDSIPVIKKKVTTPFRFPVQDIYSINGKSVIVGRIASGSIQSGEKITVYPEHKEALIAEIKVFNKKNVHKAHQGENIGLIPDKEIPVKRGDVIVRFDDDIRAIHHVNVYIFWMSETPLETGTRITLCCATQEVSCIVKEIEGKINSSTFEMIENNINKLKRHEAGRVTLNIEDPIVLEKSSLIEELGRLLFKRNNQISGAGIILTIF